ncbi:MAG: winged helix-turn-helix transcriptional regulator [Ruminococcaceae bacterium]|nr:winged helix-turn-helix transcriptional regulator [Oscillospiraceae bacterium]
MLIVSGDEMFSLALRQYLEDSKLDSSVLEKCIIIDLDFSAENARENSITFSRDESKFPDLVRPFLMTDLLDLVKERFSGDFYENASVAEAESEDMILTSDGVTYRGVFISLTPKESEVLSLLLSRRGCALSREEIFKLLWKDDTAGSNVVDVYIRYLRKKLDFRFGERIIYTRRGCGYYVK